MIDRQKLDEMHKKIPVDFYHEGIKRNIFQKIWHEKRFKEILKMIKLLKISDQDLILDLGCNTAYLSYMIAEATGARVTGMDISPKAIDAAKEKYGDKMTLLAGDISGDLPFSDNTFKLIMAFDVIEHVIDLDKTLLSIKRTLKPGGIFIVSIPVENFLFKIIWGIWTKTKGKVLKGIHVHNLNPDKINDLLTRYGFKKIAGRTTHFKMWHLAAFQKFKDDGMEK